MEPAQYVDLMSQLGDAFSAEGRRHQLVRDGDVNGCIRWSCTCDEFHSVDASAERVREWTRHVNENVLQAGFACRLTVPCADGSGSIEVELMVGRQVGRLHKHDPVDDYLYSAAAVADFTTEDLACTEPVYRKVSLEGEEAT